MRSSVLVLGVSLLALPATAHAHFTLTAPPPASNSTDGGKGSPPCGPTSMLSNVVTPVMGGSKLLVKVNETVTHPGFYRVALSINSRSELPADNVVKDSSGKVLPPAGPGNSATAVYQETPVFPVLADNLFPHTNGDVKMFQAEITLPNVNCDKCTLQVIEFMAQHGADYFYRHCADLKITADTSKPIFDPTAGSGAGGGSSGGAGGTAGAAGAAVGGTAGAASGGSGGTVGSSAGSPSVGVSGGGTGSAVAGAPALAGSPGSAGVSTGAGATGTPNTGESADSGGCNINQHATGSKSVLALLVGLLVLGRRRNRRR